MSFFTASFASFLFSFFLIAFLAIFKPLGQAVVATAQRRCAGNTCQRALLLLILVVRQTATKLAAFDGASFQRRQVSHTKLKADGEAHAESLHRHSSRCDFQTCQDRIFQTKMSLTSPTTMPLYRQEPTPEMVIYIHLYSDDFTRYRETTYLQFPCKIFQPDSRARANPYPDRKGTIMNTCETQINESEHERSVRFIMKQNKQHPAKLKPNKAYPSKDIPWCEKRDKVRRTTIDQPVPHQILISNKPSGEVDSAVVRHNTSVVLLQVMKDTGKGSTPCMPNGILTTAATLIVLCYLTVLIIMSALNPAPLLVISLPIAQTLAHASNVILFVLLCAIGPAIYILITCVCGLVYATSIIIIVALKCVSNCVNYWYNFRSQSRHAHQKALLTLALGACMYLGPIIIIALTITNEARNPMNPKSYLQPYRKIASKYIDLKHLNQVKAGGYMIRRWGRRNNNTHYNHMGRRNNSTHYSYMGPTQWGQRVKIMRQIRRHTINLAFGQCSHTKATAKRLYNYAMGQLTVHLGLRITKNRKCDNWWNARPNKYKRHHRRPLNTIPIALLAAPPLESLRKRNILEEALREHHLPTPYEQLCMPTSYSLDGKRIPLKDRDIAIGTPHNPLDAEETTQTPPPLITVGIWCFLALSSECA